MSHDGSQSVWHDNGYDNVEMFGLGGIGLLRCCFCYFCCCCRASTGLATANTHDTQLRARRAAAVQYSIHELPVADLYRWSWGRWRVSESAAAATANAEQVFEC